MGEHSALMGNQNLQLESAEDVSIIYLRGTLDRLQVPNLWTRLSKALKEVESRQVIIDCGKVSDIDNAGLAMLLLAERECEKRRLDCSYRNEPAQVAEFRRFAEEREEKEPEQSKSRSQPDPVTRTGLWAEGIIDASRQALDFFGKFLIAVGLVFRRPRKLHIKEILYHLQKTGAEAIPFVFLLSGLMGFIVGMQSTSAITAFGAGIQVANAVTLGTMKEMAPLLTGVIIVGRSGAAFTAELATMKIKEEIDALDVMGFDPVHYLVLPRVLGLAFTGPLLTMIADAAGILGGTFQGMFVLGLSPINYLVEVGQTMQPEMIFEGLIKGFAFALMIAGNGCFHGLRAGTAAENVGVQTTISVVSGIFLIVLLDALLASVFHVFVL